MDIVIRINEFFEKRVSADVLRRTCVVVELIDNIVLTGRTLVV